MRWNWGEVVRMGAWAALMAPLTTILHELGHWSVARLSGFPVRLNPTSVTALPGAREFAMPALGQAAGPIVTLILTFGAVLLIRRFGPMKPLIAIALTAPSRMLVIYGYLGVVLMLTVRGLPLPHPNFDEYNALRSLHLPVLPILLMIAVLLPIAWKLTVRAVPRGERFATVSATLVGGAVGMAAWVMLLGPALLGQPPVS